MDDSVKGLSALGSQAVRALERAAWHASQINSSDPEIDDCVRIIRPGPAAPDRVGGAVVESSMR